MSSKGDFTMQVCYEERMIKAKLAFIEKIVKEIYSDLEKIEEQRKTGV